MIWMYCRLFLFFIIVNNCYSQSLESVSHVVKSGKPLSNKNITDLNYLLEIDYLKLRILDRERGKFEAYHRIASVHYCLDSPRDTILYYMNKCRNADPNLACKYFQETSKKMSAPSDPFGGLYVMSDFDSIWWNNFLSNCEILPDYSISIGDKSKNNIETDILLESEYSEILDTLEYRDQFYRKVMAESQFIDTMILKLQYEIDRSNRKTLDSLFLEFGFPTAEKVGQNGLNAAWLVLHHSIDCEWNIKWIYYFLNNYNRDSYKNLFLDHTISRFFDPIDGYCNKDSVIDLRDSISIKYDNHISKIYGKRN